MEYKLEDIMAGASNKAVPSSEKAIQNVQETMPAKNDFELAEISPEDRKEIDRIKTEIINKLKEKYPKYNYSIIIDNDYSD